MRLLVFCVCVSACLLPSFAWAQTDTDASVPSASLDGGATPTASPTPEVTPDAGGVPASDAVASSAPSSDAGAAEPAPAAPALLPWRNSVFIFDQSVSIETMNPNVQLSDSPSYQWWMSIRPRWYFTRTLSLRVRQDMTLEWFPGSADTTRIREPQFGDLWTDVAFTGIPSFGGITSVLGARLQWPVSLTSRARGVIVTAGIFASLNRSFSLGKGGDLSLGITMVASHPFTNSNTTGILGQPIPCAALDIALPSLCTTQGTLNSVFALNTMFTIGYSAPFGLSWSALYLLSDSWAAPTPDATLIDSMGGMVTVPRAGDDTRLRQSSFFSTSVDYDVTKWLNLSLTYYVFRSILNPDGTYGNPFWAPGNSSRFTFTMTFTLDQIYSAIVGQREGRGGRVNVRGVTMNETRPRQTPQRRNIPAAAASGLFMF